MMKKLTSLFFTAIVLIVTLAGCNSAPSPAENIIIGGPANAAEERDNLSSENHTIEEPGYASSDQDNLSLETPPQTVSQEIPGAHQWMDVLLSIRPEQYEEMNVVEFAKYISEHYDSDVDSAMTAAVDNQPMASSITTDEKFMHITIPATVSEIRSKNYRALGEDILPGLTYRNSRTETTNGLQQYFLVEIAVEYQIADEQKCPVGIRDEQLLAVYSDIDSILLSLDSDSDQETAKASCIKVLEERSNDNIAFSAGYCLVDILVDWDHS